MRIYGIIKRKKENIELTKEEIEYFVKGYTSGEIPDYQAAALCMAIYFNGMSVRETTDLTLAIRDSGERIDFSKIDGIRVDKHSSGGVGDKTSLVIAPIVASCGVKVPKISGRGLGHTGGTVDKLESIEGFNVSLSSDEFIKIVNEVGTAIIGQTKNIAPADKKLYALRDVTATIDSMPLIASSIMGKKLASDDNCILLDVKTGSGAFMKTVDESVTLARLMVDIGKRAGKKMMAVVTDMDKPLGNAIGNSLEVIEAVNTLKGNGPKDFTEICIILATNMLYLAGIGDKNECEKKVKDAITSGRAFETFLKMVKCQGGNIKLLENTDLFKKARFVKEVKVAKSGYIEKVDAEFYGVASLVLGAGRNKKEDKIDYSAGIILHKKTGDYVNIGDTIATLYTNDENAIPNASEKLLLATTISNKKPSEKPIVFETIGG